MFFVNAHYLEFVYAFYSDDFFLLIYYIEIDLIIKRQLFIVSQSITRVSHY